MPPSILFHDQNRLGVRCGFNLTLHNDLIGKVAPHPCGASMNYLSIIQCVIWLIMTHLVIQVSYAATWQDCLTSTVSDAQVNEFELATTYKQGVALQDYLVSEKLDGVRARWTGSTLITRNHNIIHAPAEFIAQFPTVALDGELWITRGAFARTSGLVRQQNPSYEDWHSMRLMVFDLPDCQAPFAERLIALRYLLQPAPSPHLALIPQWPVANHNQLMTRLQQIEKQGGEGLMLHLKTAYYEPGRSRNVLKVKSYQDGEAVVIGHIPGSGRYQACLGALLVKNERGQQFRLGTGFTDVERCEQPPPINSLVTYKHYGVTATGLPRFASFLRIREPAPADSDSHSK
jgi:DNA ligase-1